MSFDLWGINQTPVAAAAGAAAGLPFTSDFETGDLTEWNGGASATLSASATNPITGTYSARAIITAPNGTDNYQDYYFGDSLGLNSGTGNPVSGGLWLKFDIEFETGYNYGTANYNKIAIINFERDESGTNRRRYQIIIDVQVSTGNYYIEHLSWNADGTFDRSVTALSQNVAGTDVGPVIGTPDTLKLYIESNTLGQSDGIVRLWVNNVLRINYTNVPLRESVDVNPNKLIMSNYVTDSNTDGVMKWDNWTLSESDPNPLWIPPSDFPANPSHIDVFPYYVDFNTEALSLLAATNRIDATAVAVWEETGAYDGTPCMRLHPPTNGQSDCGWGPFEDIQDNFPNTYVLSVGFMLYHGPTYLDYDTGNKLIIQGVVLKSNAEQFTNRPMVFLTNDLLGGATYEACDGTICDQDFTFNINDFVSEWLWIEQVADLVAGTNSLYVTPATNDFNTSSTNPYLVKTIIENGADRYLTEEFRHVDGIGFYRNYGVAYGAGTYTKFSHISLSNAYQGPPPGFLT